MDNLPRIALLGTFVGRGRERQVGEDLRSSGGFYTLAAPATGTAASEVLQVLGIGETSRTLTLSLVPRASDSPPPAGDSGTACL